MTERADDVGRRGVECSADWHCAVQPSGRLSPLGLSLKTSRWIAPNSALPRPVEEGQRPLTRSDSAGHTRRSIVIRVVIWTIHSTLTRQISTVVPANIRNFSAYPDFKVCACPIVSTVRSSTQTDSGIGTLTVAKLVTYQLRGLDDIDVTRAHGL